MYDAYYLYKVDHLSVQEIMSKLSLSRSKAYSLIRTFACRNREIAEKMQSKARR